MAKNDKQPQKLQPQQIKISTPVMNVQNSAPQIWNSFEACWNSCVKNGDAFTMNSCKEHLKSLGILKDKSRWIEGMRHFGIKIEKNQ